MVEEVFTIFVEDEIQNRFYIKKEGFVPNSVEAHNAKVDYRKFLLSKAFKKFPTLIIIGEKKVMTELELLKFLKEQLGMVQSYPDEYKRVMGTK